MLAIVSLLCILTLSIAITKVAAVALTHTGLSRQSARLQARSAFTGVGFTTSESEKMVNHPVRRRILMTLMILGNAGIVTVMSTLIVGLVGATRDEAALAPRIALLMSGLVALWAISSSAWVDRQVARWVRRALGRFTDIDVRDYASLLHVSGDYAVVELEVEPGDWLAGRALRELELPEEGVLVLGVQRPDGTFLGAPSGGTCIEAGDVVLLYGRGASLRELDERRAGWRGEVAHHASVREYEDVKRVERREDDRAGSGEGAVREDAHDPEERKGHG